MRKIPEKELRIRGDLLKKRQRSEWSQLVYDGCIGRTMEKVATILGYSQRWVQEHLRDYAINAASRGGGGARPQPKGLKRDAVREVIKKYAPKQPSPEALAKFEIIGQLPDVARCLATAYEAGEVAVEKGAIKVTKTMNASDLTLTKNVGWKMDLTRACRWISSAAGFIDNAKMSDLEKVSTRKMIASAHAKWMWQIERIENIHPTFSDEVNSHEERV